MSLPIAGGPPPREPTHQPLDFVRLIGLAGEVQEAVEMAGADALTPALVEEIAEELGARESHVYAAAAVTGVVPCDSSDELRFEICIGGCQQWGAVELLDHLLDVHGRRRAQSKPSFGIVAKRCLDKCSAGAVLFIHTPDGSAGIGMATVEKLDEALSELLE